MNHCRWTIPQKAGTMPGEETKFWSPWGKWIGGKHRPTFPQTYHVSTLEMCVLFWLLKTRWRLEKTPKRIRKWTQESVSSCLKIELENSKIPSGEDRSVKKMALKPVESRAGSRFTKSKVQSQQVDMPTCSQRPPWDSIQDSGFPSASPVMSGHLVPRWPSLQTTELSDSQTTASSLGSRLF